MRPENLAELLENIEKKASELAEAIKMLREIKEFQQIRLRKAEEVELSLDQRNYLLGLVKSRKIPKKRASELIDELKKMPMK